MPASILVLKLSMLLYCNFSNVLLFVVMMHNVDNGTDGRQGKKFSLEAQLSSRRNMVMCTAFVFVNTFLCFGTCFLVTWAQVFVVLILVFQDLAMVLTLLAGYEC